MWLSEYQAIFSPIAFQAIHLGYFCVAFLGMFMVSDLCLACFFVGVFGWLVGLGWVFLFVSLGFFCQEGLGLHIAYPFFAVEMSACCLPTRETY